MAAVESGTDLKDAAAAAMPDAPYEEVEDAPYDDVSSIDVADWLFDDARQEGDAAVVESGDLVYAVVFQGRVRDEGKRLVDVRHILIRPEEGELVEDDEGYEDEQAQLLSDAEAKAEEIYAEWQAGEATEESFGALAAEYTDDSNGADGGLYEDVYQGQMVEEFDAWCFDPAREPGDTDIVQTTFGYHIMYYVGDDRPYWKTGAEAALRTEDQTAWAEALTEGVTIERDAFGMRFVL